MKRTGKSAVCRVLTLVLCVIIAVGMIPMAYAAGTVAVKSNQPIYIDGNTVEMTAYNIGGNNYVRLRDITAALDIDVYFDGTDGSVHFSTTEPFFGGAALGQTPERAEANETQLTVYVDNRQVSMSAYNIGGNNYIKLRDVGAAIDFAVDWDSARRCVVIDTTNPYTPIPESTPAVPEAVPEPEVSEFPTPAEIIPGGTAVDYSLEANPEIFDNYYTREKYNQDRQRVLDTGTTVVDWGTSCVPQSETAIYAADRFFESIAGKSDLEKVQAINDFLCAHLTYKKGVSFIGDDFWTGTSYGVCEEYALMFQYICYRSGLPCFSVRGARLPASPTGRHAWNEVYVDGKWQFYDGTLSDSRRRIIIDNSAESANTGYTYTADSPKSTMCRKEVYKPGSTI